VLYERIIAAGEVDIAVRELAADSVYLAAFQRPTRTEFKRAIRGALKAYLRSGARPRARARASFCSYWLLDQPDERRRILLGEVLPRAREAAEETKRGPNQARWAQAHFELLECLAEGDCISSDQSQAESLAQEALRIGREALTRFIKTSDSAAFVAVTNEFVVMLNACLGIALTPEQQAQLDPVLITLGRRLSRVAGSLPSSRLRSLAYEAIGWIEFGQHHDYTASTADFRTALGEAHSSRDSLLIGREALFTLISMAWQYETSDNEGLRQSILRSAGPYASLALSRLKVSLCAGQLSQAYYWSVGFLKEMAKSGHPQPSRLAVLTRAVLQGRQGSRYGRYCPLNSVAQSLAEVALVKADLLASRPARWKTLSEAKLPLEDLVSRVQARSPVDPWNLGCYLGTLGTVELKLASATTSGRRRRGLLLDSCAHLTHSVELLSRSPTLAGHENTPAEQSEQLGAAYVSLHALTERSEDARSAIRAFEDAIRFYSRLRMHRFMAPLASKVAEVYEALSEPSRATEARGRAAAFLRASKTKSH